TPALPSLPTRRSSDLERPAVVGGAERDGVDQVRPGTDPPELEEVGALAVAEPVRPLGVHRDRARARRERLDRVQQRLRRAHHLRSEEHTSELQSLAYL